MGCIYTLPCGGETEFIGHAGQRAWDSPAVKVDKDLQRKEDKENNGSKAHVNSRVLLLRLLRLLLFLPLLPL